MRNLFSIPDFPLSSSRCDNFQLSVNQQVAYYENLKISANFIHQRIRREGKGGHAFLPEFLIVNMNKKNLDS